MILLASIPSSYVETPRTQIRLPVTSASPASAMHTAATEAAVTTAETAMRSTTGASALHPTAKTAGRVFHRRSRRHAYRHRN